MKTRFYILLSMTLLLLTQTSCIYDNDIPCGSEDPDLLVINLNLTVPSSSTGTRSTGHEPVAGSKDENYINVIEKDFQVLMFDKDGALVKGILSDFECKENDVNGEMTSYTLTTKLSLSSNEDKERLKEFKIMVLANWESFERSNTKPAFEYPSFEEFEEFEDYNLSNIYKEREKFNFTFAAPTTESPKCWVPSINDKRAIPMFGVTDEVDLQFAIDMAKYGDGPSFNVPMLRAMAKVEIIDELIDRIGSVSLSSANQSGRFIPEIDERNGTNTGWSDPDTQIKTPSIPDNPGTIDKIQFVQGPVVKGPDSDGKRTWVAYIPEMDFRDIDENLRPQFTIYDGDEQLDPKPFNNYINGEVVKDPNEYLPAVLRNHIYSFRVTITDKAKVSIKLEVLPWDMEYDDTPSYFDSPEVAKWLEWKTVYDEDDNVDEDKVGEPNEFLDDDEKLILTMKPTTEEYAQATFTLEAPKNCRWYAQLQPLGGSSNAFYFVDANGDAITTNGGNPEGVIGKAGDHCTLDGNGNTLCTIRIKNSSATVNNRPNEAKLMVFVEYPDKTHREVKVVEAVFVKEDGAEAGKWVDNYTIYQEQTDLYD